MLQSLTSYLPANPWSKTEKPLLITYGLIIDGAVECNRIIRHLSELGLYQNTNEATSLYQVLLKKCYDDNGVLQRYMIYFANMIHVLKTQDREITEDLVRVPQVELPSAFAAMLISIGQVFQSKMELLIFREPANSTDLLFC